MAPVALAPVLPATPTLVVFGTLVNVTVTSLFGPDAGFLLAIEPVAPVIFAVNLSVAFFCTFTALATVLNDFSTAFTRVSLALLI